MESLPSALRFAFWGAHRSTNSGQLAQTEKIWARLRWLGVWVWWYFLSPSDSFVLQPAATVLFVAALAYCGLTHYLAYRLHKNRPVPVPVPLLDTALVTLLCSLSGGTASHAFAYFYGIILVTGISFGWLAALLLVMLQTFFILEMHFFIPGLELQLSSVGWQIAYLFLVAGLSGSVSPQPPLPQKTPHVPLPQDATEQLWAINRALTSLDVDTAMQQLVDTIDELLPSAGVGLVLLNRRSEQAERIATAGGFPILAATDLTASLAEGGLLRQACDRGTLVFETPEALQNHPESAVFHDVAEHNLLVTPVMHPDYPQPLGCLLVADHNVPDGFETDIIDFLTTVAEQTAVAMENAELFEALEEEERQLRGLLHTLISTQEEERKRLVEDWHARLGEKLFEVLQDFRRSKDVFLQRVPEAKEQIDRLVTEIDTMAATVRNLTDELHPATLDNFGFIAALEEYIAKLRENSLFRVTLEAQEPLLPLTPSANLTLFRITQEALENVNKHAQAQHVEIAFVQEHKGMSLLIKDDGQGFNLEQHPQGQYGLLYMRERAEACGGTLRVFSARGRGTEVRVDVPIE